MKVFRLLPLSALCACLGAMPALGAPPPSKIALTGGRIIPIVGEEIDGGTVLIENGVITKVGKSVDIPYDAMEIDVSGKVVMPGFVDAHSARGLDVPNENLPVTPFVDVYDAIDPSRRYFEDALRDGVTSIHAIVANNCVIGGLGRVVHPIGMTPDEMTQLAETGLKISASPRRGYDRMLQMAKLRETFRELGDYLDDLAESKYEESLEEKDEKIDVGPEEATKRGRELIEEDDYDDAHRNLVRLTRGELGAFVWCEAASDIGRALEIAKKNNYFDRTTLVLGPSCYKAVASVKKAGRPVILDPQLLDRSRDRVTGEIEETFVPLEYFKAGIPFSLLPNPDDSLAERYLNYQAARCVRRGVSRQAALEAITLNPAKAIGAGKMIGSLEEGKLGNVVVMSGDPLSFDSWVEHVYIRGVLAYEREQDVRLENLFGEDAEASGDESAEESAEEEKAADAEKGEGGEAKTEGAAEQGKDDSGGEGEGEGEGGDSDGEEGGSGGGLSGGRTPRMSEEPF